MSQNPLWDTHFLPSGKRPLKQNKIEGNTALSIKIGHQVTNENFLSSEKFSMYLFQNIDITELVLPRTSSYMIGRTRSVILRKRHSRTAVVKLKVFEIKNFEEFKKHMLTLQLETER